VIFDLCGQTIRPQGCYKVMLHEIIDHICNHHREIDLGRRHCANYGSKNCNAIVVKERVSIISLTCLTN
jgi:hypothetical protein